MDVLEDDIVKILLIGDVHVGKTAFIQRFVHDTYMDKYKATIGVDFTSKTVKSHGQTIKLQLWDIAGQERFPLLTRAYYKYTRGCIIMFDLNDAISFESVEKWKATLDSNTPNVPCVLIANKADLPKREVSTEQIEQLSQNLNMQWFETSVKDGTMVQESVSYLLDAIVEGSPPAYTPDGFEIVDRIILTESDDDFKYKRKKTCKLCR